VKALQSELDISTKDYEHSIAIVNLKLDKYQSEVVNLNTTIVNLQQSIKSLSNSNEELLSREFHIISK